VTKAKDNVAQGAVCRWCERADRKVNVQGFCCQLCYNSWLSERMRQRDAERVSATGVRKEAHAISD
jgi:hypothetical protein